MLTYILRRLFLIIPTFIGITLISFVIFQLAPGGPVESYLAKIRYSAASSGSGSESSASGSGTAKSAVTSAEVLAELNKKYGFDKPLYERYFIWLKNVATLDFGYSYTYGQPVTELIASKLPVSIRFDIRYTPNAIDCFGRWPDFRCQSCCRCKSNGILLDASGFLSTR